ncbi:MAG TPA: thiamine phosphate synthase [Gammaproteobacteria bacterium]|nr:thiamine phosphate synthase [Gammaproteobacteria bacterium]
MLTDERLGNRLETVIASALAGGARLIQYRDKTADLARRERETKALRALTRRHHALLIVNDDPDLAAEVEADGVHLGCDDPDPLAARARLGDTAVIGVSCYDSLALAHEAVAAGADYVAFGSFFSSPTKPAAVRAPLALLTAAKRELAVPLCAIGGITPEKTAALVAAGADLLAVVSSVLFAADVAAVARRMATAFEQDAAT